MQKALVALILLAATGACARPAAPVKAEPKLERVVMLMRHSVRPPTGDDVTPPGVAAQPWETWDTGFGELTPHGAQGAQKMGVYERAALGKRGLLPAAGCPAPGDVTVIASSRQRAIETAKNFTDAAFPGCNIEVAHPAKDNEDALFHVTETAGGGLDPKASVSALKARLPEGGLPALQASLKPQLDLLGRVLACCKPIACAREKLAAGCSLSAFATTLSVNKNGEPELEGVLGDASSAAQTLALEYLEGKPMEKVGWGRVSKQEITELNKLHANKFYFEARTPYVADRYAAPVARKLQEALAPNAPKMTLMVAHDGNVATLGGMLDLHWQIADYAADDPPPGGALGFEQLSQDGKTYIRAFYVAQSMDQLRNLSELTEANPPALQYLPIPGCAERAEDLCPAEKFADILAGKLEHSTASTFHK